MKLIDKTKLLEWLEAGKAQIRADRSPEKIEVLGDIIREIKSGAFDPPAPEQPKMAAGDRVQHKYCERPSHRFYKDGVIKSITASGKSAYVQWTLRLGRTVTYCLPIASLLLKEENHEQD